MIRGVHTMFYADDPTALRNFIRDKLGFPAVDVGGGWLIFDLPSADMGCHPTDQSGPRNGTPYLSFYCDDLQKTVAELKGKGVEFVGAAKDVGYGLATRFKMPGDIEVELYQPHYRQDGKLLANSL